MGVWPPTSDFSTPSVKSLTALIASSWDSDDVVLLLFPPRKSEIAFAMVPGSEAASDLPKYLSDSLEIWARSFEQVATAVGSMTWFGS